jgi:O-antigen ligase
MALEDIASVLILAFFGMAGSIPGIAPNQANEMTGSAATGLTFVAGIGSQIIVNGLILILLASSVPKLLRTLGTMQWAGALAMLAICSAAWSEDPVLSARRAIPFALAAAFALYFARRHSLERQLAIFETTFLLLALTSAALAIGFPKLGLDASTGHAGDWQGVFTQKNACGRAMVFASAVVLARGRLTLARAASLLVFVAVLALSGSRGAWVIEGLLVTVVVAYALLTHFAPRPRVLLMCMTGAASVAAAVLAKVYFRTIAALLGRDPTLTGRTAIWAQVWIAILHRPWLGYGFSAFWRGTKGASFQVVITLKFILFHAHNGFLEIWLELGVAGLLLFGLSYLRGWRQLWPQLSGRKRDGSFDSAVWPLCVLLLIAAYDFDENTLLSFNGLFWVLYVHALATLEKKTSFRRALIANKPVWMLPAAVLIPSRTNTVNRTNEIDRIDGSSFTPGVLARAGGDPWR